MPEPPTDDWPSRPPREPPWDGGDAPGPGSTWSTSEVERLGALGQPVPERSGPSPLTIGLIAALVLLLAAGTVAGAAVLRSSGSESGTGAAPPPAADPAAPEDPSDAGRPGPAPGRACRPPAVAPAGPGGSTDDRSVMAAELAVLKPFVERLRGLPFKRDVDVTILDPTAFRAAIKKVSDEERDSTAREGELLRAAGLVNPTYDVVAASELFLGGSALGFYDPRDGRLVVRGAGRFNPYLRHVLVHELTHALDDQHFNLNRTELDDVTDGRDWAFAALVEGTARWVDTEYRNCLSREDKAAFEEENVRFGLEQQQALQGMPLVLPRLATSPYDYGEPFVRALVERGGTAAIDGAYGRPPDTSEQIADINRYYAGDTALPVPAPPADGEVVSDGTLGQVMTALLLRGRETNTLGALLDPSADPQERAELMERLTRGELDLSELFGDGDGFGRLPGAEGWGGDHFVVYRVPPGLIGDVCLRADWRADTPAALEQLHGQLQTWAGSDRRVEVSRPGDGVVRITRCVGTR